MEKESQELELSVVMPVFNEEENLAEALEEARAAMHGAPFSYEILLVDDASTDRSLAILRDWESRHPGVFRVLAHKKNSGIMGALETLFSNAKGRWIFFNSSDGQFRTSDCLRLMEGREALDIVVGFRTRKLYNLWRHAVSWSFNALTRVLFGVNPRDAGSVKLYRRETLRIPLLSASPFREAERLVRASRLGYRLGFVPVEHLSRKGGRATGGHLKVVLHSLWDCVACWLSIPRHALATPAATTAAEAPVWSHAGAIILLATAALMTLTFSHYGPTWDEQLTRANGANWAQWVRTLGADRSALSTLDLHLYGAFFDGISYLFSRVSPLGPYESSHLLNVLFGWLALLGTYRLGSRLGGARAGVFALILLLSVPTFYGHSFNNPKDIPFATCFLWALESLFAVWQELPSPSRALLLRLGVWTGLALGIRVGGLLLFGYLGVFWLAWGLLTRAFSLPLLRLSLLSLGRSLSLMVAASWPVMLAFWPYAAVRPLLNPFRAMTENANFNFNPPLFFDGHWIEAKQVPWSYVPVWWANTAPEALGLALLIGVGTLFFSGPHRPRQLLLLFCAIFPVGVAIALHSTLYDGIRHFLFLWPPLALFGALGLGVAWDRLGRWRPAAFAPLLLLLCVTAVDMARLHPYQHYYFNRLIAGGVARAATRFDFDYWGNSLKEATQWLIREFPRAEGRRTRLATCGDWFQVRYWLDRMPGGGDFELVHDRPDVFLALRRENCDKQYQGEIVHSVTRMGATLLTIVSTEPAEVRVSTRGQ